MGAALLGLGFLGHAWAGTLAAHMLAVAVWTVGEIVAHSINKTEISELGPATLRGTYIGLVGSISGLATLVAPLLGGVATAATLWLTVALAFVSAGLFLVLDRLILQRRAVQSVETA